jgi:hypothetical protein
LNKILKEDELNQELYDIGGRWSRDTETCVISGWEGRVDADQNQDHVKNHFPAVVRINAQSGPKGVDLLSWGDRSVKFNQETLALG